MAGLWQEQQHGRDLRLYNSQPVSCLLRHSGHGIYYRKIRLPLCDVQLGSDFIMSETLTQQVNWP